MKTDILLIEDDLILGDVLSDFLQCNNLSVLWAKDGTSALKYCQKLHPRLIVLDVILPDINGIELLVQIRKITSQIPVIFMTDTEFSIENQVNAYKLGAMNYLKKPVIPEVLLAQINQLLQTDVIKVVELKETTITLDKQLLKINNDTIKLREKEAKLLHILLSNKHRLVERNEILLHIWHDNHPKRNAQLDSLVYSLKKVLSALPDITIEPVYGLGYSVVVK